MVPTKARVAGTSATMASGNGSFLSVSKKTEKNKFNGSLK
jgi:hypothetical protein